MVCDGFLNQLPPGKKIFVVPQVPPLTFAVDTLYPGLLQFEINNQSTRGEFEETFASSSELTVIVAIGPGTLDVKDCDRSFAAILVTGSPSGTLHERVHRCEVGKDLVSRDIDSSFHNLCGNQNHVLFSWFGPEPRLQRLLCSQAIICKETAVEASNLCIVQTGLLRERRI